MPWIPEEIKQEYLARYRNKKTEVNQKMLEKMFKKILEKYNIKPLRLRVKEGKTGLFEVVSLNDSNTNIELTYNALTLPLLDHEELESLLYHEAFHPLTQKGSNIVPVLDVEETCEE